MSKPIYGCLGFFVALAITVIASCTTYFSQNDPTLIIAPDNEVVYSERALTQGKEVAIRAKEAVYFDTGTFSFRLKTAQADTTITVTLKEGQTVKIASQQGYLFIVRTYIN